MSQEEAKRQVELETISLSSELVSVLDRREIHRALAISITIAYFSVLAFVMFGKLENAGVISSLSKIFLVVIAFYFGSRAVEDALKLYKGSRPRKLRNQRMPKLRRRR